MENEATILDTAVDYMNHNVWNGNSPKQLLYFVGALCITAFAAWLIHKLYLGLFRRLASKTKTKLDDIILETTEKPLHIMVVVLGIALSTKVLNLPPAINQAISNARTLLLMILLAWSLHRFVNQINATYVASLMEKSDAKIDQQIANIIEKTLKTIIWILCVLIAADNIGFDVVSILTGLGIGGIAIAMAAKDTLSNIFGSITLFADKPFHLGDTIKINDQVGTVSEVGLRTFRMTTFEGTIITIPNALLVGGPIENISARTARRYLSTLSLTYSMSVTDLKAAIEAFKEILKANPKIREDYSVLVESFAASSIEIRLLFWVVPPEDYFQTVSDVLLECKNVCDQNHWDFAFPSLSIYQGGDLQMRMLNSK